MSTHIDLTGKTFGLLTVTSCFGINSSDRDRKWNCECKCGNLKIIRGYYLRNGERKSCGCTRRENLTGRTFGYLTVLEFSCLANNYTAKWKCKCRCGKEVVVYGFGLKSGNTRSCGCLVKEVQKKRMTTHGMSRTRIYGCWHAMHQRCKNPNVEGFEDYGGRGITVCKRWDKFENFYSDMGDRPRGLSLERIEVNGNYCPENCCWATKREQVLNRRKVARIDQFTNDELLAELKRRNLA